MLIEGDCEAVILSPPSADVRISLAISNMNPSDQKKILIVDDDPQVHKILSTVLTKNYDVDLAADATQALSKMAVSKPDLIILDIMMPDMSGIELCQKIRNESHAKGPLILMLSAKDTQADRIKGLQYGADDYVTKPFHVSTLVHKIEHMLSKSGDRSSPKGAPSGETGVRR